MSVNFQNQDEVKDYLQNIGTEYRFGCYSEKNPECKLFVYINIKHDARIYLFFLLLTFAACHLLGDYLETIRKDYEKARIVYQSNCNDYNYPRSCLKYGNYAFIGKGKSGVKGNPAEALQYYEKGCGLGDSDNCLHSGLINVSKPMDGANVPCNFRKVDRHTILSKTIHNNHIFK